MTLFYRAWICAFLLAGSAIFPLRAADDGTVLHVFTWSGYFSPEVVASFEKEYDCRVEFDHYDSNDTMFEMLTGEDGYDIITPSSNAAVPLNSYGWLMRLDHARLPNLKYIDANSPALANDPAMQFSVPYTATVTGIGYNKDLVPPDALGSWAILDDSRFNGKMAMLNDMRETLGAGLKFLGFSLNTKSVTEVDAAGDMLEEWKRHLVAFNVDGAREDLAAGALLVIQAYSGDIAYLEKERGNIGFFVPREGGAFNADMFVIPADTNHEDLAYSFINFFLDPDNAARNMDYIRYYMPNPEALKKVDSALMEGDAFSAPGHKCANCEPIMNLGDERAIYDAAWTEALLGE